MERAKWIAALWMLTAFGVSQHREHCPVEELGDPGPVLLNDLLVDYRPADPVFGGGLKKVTICGSDYWDQKRPSVMRRARRMLGESPEVSGPLTPETLTIDSGGKTIKLSKVRFQSGTGDVISGYLLIPEGRARGTKLPAVLALHSTIAAGAAVTVGLEAGRENRNYGQELAERGYVVLAVDTIAAGERIYPGSEPFVTKVFDDQYPNWSAMGKMLSDHQRALDYLCTLPQVDVSRIGVVGHSLGGYNAFFLQAFDERVKAAVSSCGFTPLGGTTSPFQFARDQWFVHFPGLRDYLRVGVVPCDLHEVMALCAPRPLFNYSARRDHIFPSWAAVDSALTQVAAIYGLLGAGEAFQRVDGEGDHDFPLEVRIRAYQFLDRFLASPR